MKFLNKSAAPSYKRIHFMWNLIKELILTLLFKIPYS
jgi:hypothetical protein